MTRIDEETTPGGGFERRIWPDAPDGEMRIEVRRWHVTTDATNEEPERGEWVETTETRPLTADEIAAGFPPPPLIDPDELLDDETVAASIALLTEDSVGYRAVIEALVATGVISERVIVAAQAKATERLAQLADNPKVRRAMMADRIARAEQVRR